MQYTVYIGSAHTLGVRGNVYREKSVLYIELVEVV